MTTDRIELKKFFITDEGDIIVTMDNGAFLIDLKHDERLHETIKVTRQVIYDATFMKVSEFSKIYEPKLLQNHPLSISEFYKRIRKFIVDEKVGLDRSLTKSRINKNQGGQKLSTTLSSNGRKGQVRDLLNQGETSPSKIAKLIGANAGYISKLIKDIKSENN